MLGTSITRYFLGVHVVLGFELAFFLTFPKLVLVPLFIFILFYFISLPFLLPLENLFILSSTRKNLACFSWALCTLQLLDTNPLWTAHMHMQVCESKHLCFHPNASSQNFYFSELIWLIIYLWEFFLLHLPHVIIDLLENYSINCRVSLYQW